ncbi:hypothetical protein FEE96_06875 [Parasedimentitalea maritima]|uniref:Uncharacterized protein n=1 Tax=Parasedimentitalea maritima TaxID=2578117 RepID=A0ABY2UZ97_9RHOB|nr:hypothetical protein [Zongyanglinia marina]TLP67066.1 hypothetical protein FEE96_06875 [Zongyanglinia marina]
MSIYDFISQNLLATYGAAVGTIALALNFMRYRHAITGSKIRLQIEVLTEKTEEAFQAHLNPPAEELSFSSAPTSCITHKVKVRNVGGVTAHLQDVWVETQNGRKNATMPYGGSQQNIYGAVSERGNVEIAPRSSHSFSVFSTKEGGYLEIKSAHATDETGKSWRTSRFKRPT